MTCQTMFGSLYFTPDKDDAEFEYARHTTEEAQDAEGPNIRRKRRSCHYCGQHKSVDGKRQSSPNSI